MSNIISIVGRPNVGKSTLFNRLTKSRHAIVDSTSGVTRDRHYGKVDWNGIEFSVIDTGGYVIGSDDIFEAEIRKQAEIAIAESDLVVFMVDVMAGITGMDQELAQILRRSRTKVLVVANKVDNNDRLPQASEFYSFGMGEIYSISSINGKGTGELLDEIVSSFTPSKIEQPEDLPRFAVVGRPNVGKSSFVNALIGEDRNIVTDIAGTTRDAIDTHYTAFGHDFILVDTAGVRKKGKVHEDLEFYSVMRSIRAIENCDVVILLIEALEGMNAQDMNIFHLAERNSKGIVILVNKWDTMEKKETNTIKEFTKRLHEKIAPFTDVPVVFTSVLEKQRLLKALETAVDVNTNRRRRISTSKINQFMEKAIHASPPPAIKGKYIKVKYATQLPTHSPAFAFFCNLPQYVKEPYMRYIENRLREEFNFHGVPIKIFFRKK
ncbi:MAG: ribosome biogenesis GTPase Der [Flavobacteriales bacterium]|nr:ribosome biogenesis GTPase Der [Flavobacteriales bacterium]